MVVQIESDAEADGSLTNGIFPPVFDGLVGFWEHQGAIDRARLNLADGSLATVTGSPTVESDGMTCTPLSHYLTTGVVTGTALTMIVVAKTVDTIDGTPAGQPAYGGTFSADTTTGWSLWTSAGAQRASARFGGASIGASASVTDPAAWAVRAVRLQSAVGLRVDHLTSGAGALTGNAGAHNASAGPVRIGSVYATNLLGRSKILRTAVYNRYLTDSEMAAMKAWLATQVAAVNPAIVV